MVKISIIIPTFNSEKFLKITLKSILSQTYKNYEVIVCESLYKALEALKGWSHEILKACKLI